MTNTIPENIVRAIKEAGYDTLRPVQNQCIPLLMEGKSIAVQAHTGSGKTAAFLIPSLSMAEEDAPYTQVLILSPTRELALQTGNLAGRFSVYTRIHTAVCIGGIDIEKQINALKMKPALVVGTPGRIIDLMHQGKLDLSKLKLLVMDEADQLISTGQKKETEEILSNIQCPRALFSATLKEEVLSFLPPDYEMVVLDEQKVSDNIKTWYIETEDKQETLLEVLKHTDIQNCIIFVHYRSTASKLSSFLQKHHMLSSAFSSDKEEKERIRILKDFEAGKIRILCATDAAARGLDLSHISHIIHYDPSIDEETYIHRSGRSGHQGQDGAVISLITKEDDSKTIRYIKEQSHPFPVSCAEQYDLSQPLKRKAEPEKHYTKLIIKAGRNDKLRPKDIIGALCTMFAFEDIGILEIQDHYSTVIIKKNIALKESSLSIKGKKRKIECAKY